MPYAAAVYTLTETVGIDRPSVDVWAILIDFPNAPPGRRTSSKSARRRLARPALGTTFVARRLFGGWETIDCRITAWQDGCAVTMELQGGVVRRASVTYAVEPTGADSCRVSYSIEGQMRPLLADHAIHPRDRTPIGAWQPRQPRASRRTRGHRISAYRLVPDPRSGIPRRPARPGRPGPRSSGHHEWIVVVVPGGRHGVGAGRRRSRDAHEASEYLGPPFDSP